MGIITTNAVSAAAAGGTSSNFGAAFPTAGTAAGFKDSAGVNMQPGNLDASGNLKVNVAAGSSGNAAASATGAAVPASAGYTGVKVGANLQGATGVDVDTSGVTHEYVMEVNLRKSASGGSVELGILANPVRTDPTGTTTQPVSGTVTANQGGAPWSATVAAATTGGATPFTYIAAGSANQDSQNIKNAAGTLYGISGFCPQASIRYLKVYDKATAPTSADTPIYRMLIPGNASGAGAVDPIGLPGINFANGLGIRITTGIADNDTGTATANDAVVNLRYK